MPIEEHHLAVTRTARWCSLGEPAGAREVWLALHGHGQLAAVFLKGFVPLDDGTRYVVAPEALSRFYLDGRGGMAPDPKVGATWMTREDRLAEIQDYLGYLDALYAQVIGLVPPGARVTLLGFSQGVATAARWACRGRARLDRLVLWAGQLPPELGEERDVAALREVRIVRVVGTRDEFATPKILAAEEARFRALGLEATLVRFDGGHRLDDGALRDLAR